MVKIHILGSSGSGKTTLARDLASRLHIPHYDLDKINWKQESAIAIAEQPAWVTEGIYLILTEPMLYHADRIVLLEVSWPVAAWRMICRHVLNSLRGTNQYPGINGVKALFKLLKYNRRYILNLDQSNIDAIEDIHAYLEMHRDEAVPPTEDFLKAYLKTYQEFIAPPAESFVRMYLESYKDKTFLIRNKVDRERLFALLAKGNDNIIEGQ